MEQNSQKTDRDLLGESTAEDNMNVQLKDITVTARDGRVSHLEQVYIRGSHVRFFIVPDMLRCVSLAIRRVRCDGWKGR
jgi:small nuclear ribonucleoprotein D3